MSLNKSEPILVKYRLHGGYKPYFIKEGVYSNISFDGVYAGWTDINSHIPDTLVELTPDEIKQYEEEEKKLLKNSSFPLPIS